ncbi:MAG: treY, partial [Herminiimonas sp.]|nr:treY [Herminiimonas sp.]
LLHDPAGAEPLTTLWTELTGGPGDFESEVRAARRQLLAQNFVGELDAAARSLLALARADLHTRDFSLASIRRVLTELLVHFPVYRTYAGTGGRDPLDEQVFERAASEARACLRNADQPMLEVIGGWLGGNAPRSEMRELYLRAITRFQQLTPPLAAKSVEDTAFYRYGRLLSRNEVGADPGQFSLGIEAFHQLCGERAQRFPNNLLATATHDHKRGEDTRARLAILSEIPLQWGQTVRRWMALNGPLGAPRPYDELMLYQALVGAWPLELTETDQEGLRALVERIAQWQTKALREAKRASDWALPDEAYETACREFLFRIFDPDTNAVFIKELAAWVRRIAPAGAVNSLSQTVLRLTTPGVPDLYQGTELWDFSLVDPDNRRPVDHGLRREMLARKTPSIDSLAGWQNGWIKQAIIHHGLALRAREPELFAGGDYIPLAVEGARSPNVIAFLRRHQDHAAITVTTRFPAGITDIANLAIDETSAEPSVPESAWEDTMLILPDSAQLAWRDCFTGKRIQADAGRLRLTDVFCLLPVALLHALN